MKLSEIITYKNLLESLTPLDSMPVAHDILSPVLKTVENSNVQFDHLTRQLQQNYRYVVKTLNDFEDTLENIKQSLQESIEQSEHAYYRESTELYKNDSGNDTDEYILNRKLPIFDEVVGQLINRIQSHNNWHHAGMIIRPGREDWINYLVGCDPMYLMDMSYELLEPAVLRFNDQYRRRLRTYVLQETSDGTMFDKIPNQQLGICLIWNFFNYKPIEVIESYLKELYNKLKPGGTIAMTFNDCDRAAGVELAERYFMSYTPARAMLDMVKKLGYVVTYNFRTGASNTWLELQRPGELTSIKGGQSLAKILYKDEYFHYTKEQIKNIKQQAADLNIARSDELDQMPIGQIVTLLNQRTSK